MWEIFPRRRPCPIGWQCDCQTGRLNAGVARCSVGSWYLHLSPWAARRVGRRCLVDRPWPSRFPRASSSGPSGSMLGRSWECLGVFGLSWGRLGGSVGPRGARPGSSGSPRAILHGRASRHFNGAFLGLSWAFAWAPGAPMGPLHGQLMFY